MKLTSGLLLVLLTSSMLMAARQPKVFEWEGLAAAPLPDLNPKSSEATRERLRKQYAQRAFGKPKSAQFQGLVKIVSVREKSDGWEVVAGRGLTDAQEIGKLKRIYNPPHATGGFGAAGGADRGPPPARDRSPLVTWTAKDKPSVEAGKKFRVSGPIIDANWTAETITVSLDSAVSVTPYESVLGDQ